MNRLSLRPGYIRHDSSYRLFECHPARQPKVCRTSIRTIAVLMFIAVAVVPSYSQEKPGQGASEQTSQASSRRDATTTGTSEAMTNHQVEPAQTGSNQSTTQPFVFPTRRERFNRYLKSAVGPFSLLHTGISAGLNQWRDNPEEWEQGAAGYGKRFAGGFGRNAIQQTVIYGLDSALGLDTGFKRSQHKGFFPRLKDALAANITSRTRTGKRLISVPKLAGVYTSAIIAKEVWYPARYDYKDGLKSGTTSLVTGFGLNLIREFVIRF